MIKLIALYRRPSDTAGFDQHYETVHTPLVLQYPGLKKFEVTRITGAPLGDTKYYLMAEMYFEDKDAMDAALASREGKAVARDLLNFARDLVTVFYGDAA